jgi:hypothetical protein
MTPPKPDPNKSLSMELAEKVITALNSKSLLLRPKAWDLISIRFQTPSNRGKEIEIRVTKKTKLKIQTNIFFRE